MSVNLESPEQVPILVCNVILKVIQDGGSYVFDLYFRACRVPVTPVVRAFTRIRHNEFLRG